jgi:hypothetical protein
MFHDANSNDVYDTGEGVGGVEIHLWCGGQEAQSYDVSLPSGSFAIPINDLTDGAPVAVQFVNTNAGEVTLSVPLAYGTLGDLTLTGGQVYVYGLYTQPSTIANIGFRRTEPIVQQSGIVKMNDGVGVAFPSLGRVSYRLEAKDTGSTWQVVCSVTGSNGQTTVEDTGQGAALPPDQVPWRVYRVLLERD